MAEIGEEVVAARLGSGKRTRTHDQICNAALAIGYRFLAGLPSRTRHRGPQARNAREPAEDGCPIVALCRATRRG